MKSMGETLLRTEESKRNVWNGYSRIPWRPTGLPEIPHHKANSGPSIGQFGVAKPPLVSITPMMFAVIFPISNGSTAAKATEDSEHGHTSSSTMASSLRDG